MTMNLCQIDRVINKEYFCGEMVQKMFTNTWISRKSGYE